MNDGKRTEEAGRMNKELTPSGKWRNALVAVMARANQDKGSKRTQKECDATEDAANT